MKNKKEERPPILYKKYKLLHEPQEEVYEVEVPVKSFGRRMGDWLAILILLVMVALSAIGTITLLHPEMRMLLMQIFER